MSLAMTVSESYSVGGITFPTNKQINGDGAVIQNVSIPKAWDGSLTTRTNDTDGDVTATLSAHTITDGDIVDLYWTENGIPGSARNATVGTVAGNVIPFTGAVGDVLPTVAENIIIAKQVELATEVSGDSVLAIAFSCGKKGTFVVTGSDNIEDFSKVLDAGVAFAYFDGKGDLNPITGDVIAKTFVSHDDTAAAAVMKVAFLYTNS